MDEENGGEAKGRATTRSVGPTATRSKPLRRRELEDLVTSLFMLIGHLKGMDVPPLALARALAVMARVCGVIIDEETMTPDEDEVE